MSPGMVALVSMLFWSGKAWDFVIRKLHWHKQRKVYKKEAAPVINHHGLLKGASFVRLSEECQCSSFVFFFPIDLAIIGYNLFSLLPCILFIHIVWVQSLKKILKLSVITVRFCISFSISFPFCKFNFLNMLLMMHCYLCNTSCYVQHFQGP